MSPSHSGRFRIGPFDLFILAGLAVNLMVAAILIFHHLTH